MSYAVDLNAVDHAFQRGGAPEGRLESVSLRKKRFEFPDVERLRSEQIQNDTHTMPQIKGHRKPITNAAKVGNTKTGHHY